MLKKERAAYVMKKLDEVFPKTPIPLVHSNKFELLIAVLLSAQCTDERVNKVSSKLFSLANNPKEMSKISVETIYSLIKPCGLGPKKSKNIVSISKILTERYGGKVPSTYKELEKLPGVGHNTASVVMTQWFGHSAFPVDTHIHRLAQRWGLTNGKNVVQTEKDLKHLFPKKSWNKLHLQIIFYGREFCQARSCYGLECEICRVCNPKRKTPIKTKK